MKNILITGGAGFIGSNLALQLIDEGYTVTVLDNLSEQIHGKKAEQSTLFRSIKDKVQFIHGDVTRKEDWVSALNEQEAIVHLAAETGTGQSMYQIEKYVDVNIRGTALLLDYLTNTSHQIQKVIVASSRAIYGEGKYICSKHGAVYPDSRSEDLLIHGDFELRCPICNSPLKLTATDEESKIHPKSIYGITKQNQEQMVLLTCESLGIPAVAFRYQNVYGPGQSLSNPYTGILSIFSTRILNNNPINIFEDGKESRDFVYIDDVIRATIVGLQNNHARNSAYNVGSGINTDVMTVAGRLRKLYNSDVDIKVSGNYRIGDIRHNYADLSKIRQLGFEPKVSFEDGIALFAEWVKRQAVQEDNYDQSIKEMKEKGLFK